MTLTLFLLALIAFICNFIYIKLANQFSIVDTANSRSSHQGKVVSSGGIVFALLFLGYLGFRYFQAPGFIPDHFFWTMICSGFLFSVIGFIDDRSQISAKTRLILQILTCIITTSILTPSDWYLYDIWLINYPITWVIVFFYLISFINFFNFMDGINGFAGIQALLVLIPLSLIGLSFSDIYFALGVLLVVFLTFNFPKAKMFMGDSGSYFLGMVLTVAICYHTFLTDTNIFFSLNVLMIIFWIDPVVTLLFRIANQENIFIPHNQHLYQKITRLSGSHQKTVYFFLVFYALVLIPISYLCLVSKPAISTAIFLILFLLIMMLFSFFQLKLRKI